MARLVTAKATLSIRIDVTLSNVGSKSSVGAASIGIENWAKLESRLRWIQQPGLQARVKAGAEKTDMETNRGTIRR